MIPRVQLQSLPKPVGHGSTLKHVDKNCTGLLVKRPADFRPEAKPKAAWRILVLRLPYGLICNVQQCKY